MFNSNTFIYPVRLPLEIASYEHFWAVATEGIVLQTKPNIEQKVQNGAARINRKDVRSFRLALMRISHIDNNWLTIYNYKSCNYAWQLTPDTCNAINQSQVTLFLNAKSLFNCRCYLNILRSYQHFRISNSIFLTTVAQVKKKIKKKEKEKTNILPSTPLDHQLVFILLYLQRQSVLWKEQD